MNWHGRRVLVTGHTGFKGSWLSLWLQQRESELCGVALEPPTKVNLFQDAKVERGMHSVIADIRDINRLRETFAQHRPEIVFHLAAQPLVRNSYEDPLGTYSTNVMGTANLLEAVRSTDSVRAVVVITTDKCYENCEWEWPYREIDRLGGYDPYSNSKACAELVVSAYRNSFFNPRNYERHGVAIASVRAGNVIGGGDWAEDRLVPDIIRAFQEGRPVRIRNPHAIRPWQHVLEPLRGYIAVAESLCEDGFASGEAWNFGPEQSDAQPVEKIVREMANLWGSGAQWEQEGAAQPHEANTLKLDCSKAGARLGWHPELRLTDALAMTVAWYLARLRGQEMHEFTSNQIKRYEETLHVNTALKTNSNGVHA
ncbi:MAG: CDP-glucose 4,6-dehydratase [Terracidiphilus sp.]|jgi:CDP-glucose 4,6-dehydratase